MLAPVAATPRLIALRGAPLRPLYRFAGPRSPPTTLAGRCGRAARPRIFSPSWTPPACAPSSPSSRALAYLNAGTDGPLPARAVRAAAERARARAGGRARAGPLRAPHRAAARSCAPPTRRTLGCDAADVALTTCTTEGMAQVIGGPGAARWRRDPYQRRGAPRPARRARRPRASCAAWRSAKCRWRRSRTRSARARAWWPARTWAG